MQTFTDEYRQRFAALSTTNVSDAMDSLGVHGATYGICPMWHTMGKVLGPAVTLKMTAAGETKGKHHLGVKAIDVAKSGDVIVVDNGGRIDTSCWGGVLATGAKTKGISGVVIDGACRDLDDCVEVGFNVYARGSVVATARGRVQEEATNVMIQFGGVQVRPGDVIMGDKSGVVVVPVEYIDDVLTKAESLLAKEKAMVAIYRANELRGTRSRRSEKRRRDLYRNRRERKCICGCDAGSSGRISRRRVALCFGGGSDCGRYGGGRGDRSLSANGNDAAESARHVRRTVLLHQHANARFYARSGGRGSITLP